MRNVIIPVISAIIAFTLGAAATYYYKGNLPSGVSLADNQTSNIQAAPIQPDNQFYNDLFDKQFFDQSRDPFQEMERLHQRMNQLMNPNAVSPNDNIFNGWFQNQWGDFPASSITTHQDKDFVYYELALNGQKLSKLDLTTNDGYVSIDAKLSQDSSGLQSESSIQQRFPIPPDTDPEAIVEQHPDKVTIKFKKR